VLERKQAALRIIRRGVLVTACAAAVAGIAAYTLLNLMAPRFVESLADQSIATVAVALLWAIATMPPIPDALAIGAVVGGAIGFFVDLPQ
jgi:hypothetical protein